VILLPHQVVSSVDFGSGRSIIHLFSETANATFESITASTIPTTRSQDTPKQHQSKKPTLENGLAKAPSDIRRRWGYASHNRTIESVTMAAAERDGAEDYSFTEDNQPRARGNLSTARSNEPIFTSMRNNRERITFTKKARGGDENSRPEPQGGGSRRGNWLSGKGMKLGEAFERTDVDGNFLPRISSRNPGSSGSRIPRTKSFSPPGVSPSPSHRAHNYQNIPGRSLSAPLDSESEVTGPMQGSPSPAAKNRRDRRGGRKSNFSQTSPGGHLSPGEDDAKLGKYADDQETPEIMRSPVGPTLFSKTQVGPKVEETVRTLAEKTSVSSFENEPPVRPPTTWGSKAKKSDAWMTKILSPETSVEVKDLPRDVPERHKGGADIPLPSVEDVSSVQTLTPPASRPASARPVNLSPEKSQMWGGELDFTAQSLQLSTSPRLRVNSTKLDEIRAREIESLTARAVATNRLEEIREKISEERSLAEDLARAGLYDSESKSARNLKNLEEGLSILEQSAHQGSEGLIPMRGSAAAQDGGKRGRSEREVDAAQLAGQDETWQTLRALSRVLTSKSPSPPRMDEKEVSQTGLAGPSTEEKSGEKQPNISGRISSAESNVDGKRNSGASTPPKSDVDPEERITAEARLFELQDNKSERNSIRVPSRSPSPSDDGRFDETPRAPRLDPMLLPTPRVTGAFIETPAQSARKPRKSRSIPPTRKHTDAESEGVSSGRAGSGRAVSDTLVADGRRRQQNSAASRRRPLINSARPTTVAEDLRRIKLEAQLEDSTIEDFDAMLETYKADTENNTTVLDPILDLEYDERGLPLSAKEIARRVELLTLDRMCQSIKNTSSSIRDARHGIERLEHQVSSSSMLTKEDVDSGNYIKIPVPRFIQYTPDSKRGKFGRNWKFTWFGFIVTVFIAWFISEAFMCNEFCHANQSLNPIRRSYRDPFFPFAIPTKLDQWTGEVVSGLFWDGWVALGGERPSLFGKPKPNDWWLGRSGPVGIVKDENYEGRSIFSDEMI
jgi:hypothetical protein